MESRGYEPRDKEFWWWNESVQRKKVKMTILKSGLCARMSKLEKSTRNLRMRPIILMFNVIYYLFV